MPDEPARDPLLEMESLTRELSGLGVQLAEKKISQERFEEQSNLLRERLARAESQAYALASRNEDIAKRLRTKSYAEPVILQICNHFISGSKKPLEPEFDVDRIPRYYVADEKDAKVSVDQKLLERIADLGMLTSVLFEKLPYCPRCKTPSNVYSRFKCPQCGTIDISINRMIEHIQCGTIHQERMFQVGRDLICPSCKKLLQRPDEERLVGLVCSCKACSARFEDPSQTFYCRKCGIDFDLKSSMLADVYIYNINEKTLTEIQSHLAVPAIAKMIQRDGYEATVPGMLTGKKEVQFSILAKKGTRTIAIDVATADAEVDVGPVLELYLKLLEVTPSLAILCAIPRLSSKAKEVAASHKITVVEGSAPDVLAQGITQTIASG